MLPRHVMLGTTCVDKPSSQGAATQEAESCKNASKCSAESKDFEIAVSRVHDSARGHGSSRYACDHSLWCAGTEQDWEMHQQKGCSFMQCGRPSSTMGDCREGR
eukprot:3488288-Amphidinium_carterae.1